MREFSAFVTAHFTDDRETASGLGGRSCPRASQAVGRVFDLDPGAANITPSRYRQVSVAAVESLDPDDLVTHFCGREAYRRTRFVVARRHGDPQQCALVELARDGSDDLFSPALGARVLAAAHECAHVRDESLDPGVPSHLARAAQRHPDRRCVVVEGRYRHISFLLNPAPVPLTVVDVVPPVPSKLADQVARVLDSAEDLPPMVVSERVVDSRELVADADDPPAEGLIVPCRGGGIDIEGVPVAHLDERPPFAGSTLLGCERSQQIHRWFYGADAARTIDWCPRRLLDGADRSWLGGEVTGPVLSRCCMLEEGMQRRGDTVMVPWGATLAEVRAALAALATDAGAGSEERQWTPI